MSEEKLTKEEQFKKDPDSFIHLSEIIIAVKKDPDDINKISVFIGEQGEFRLKGALGILKSRIDDLLMELKIAQRQKRMQDAKIINDACKMLK